MDLELFCRKFSQKMFCKLFVILSLTFLEANLSLKQSSYQNHVNSITPNGYSNTQKQQVYNPQMYQAPRHPNGPGNGLDTPIPVNIGYYPNTVGRTFMDDCGRDKVKMQDGSCQVIMTSGNCKITEEVIVDYETGKGICAQRLCPPDRIFVHSTQLCHDPFDPDVCPPGRELFYTLYGTSACSCPDGKIEVGSSNYHNVCEDLLQPSKKCSNYGNDNFVRWFLDFDSPSLCLPDPCGGRNLANSLETGPLIPSLSGKCFRWGQSEDLCAYHNNFSLSLDTLTGSCSPPEKTGYETFDPIRIQEMIKYYGPLIDRTPTKSSYGRSSSTRNYQFGGLQGANRIYPSTANFSPQSYLLSNSTALPHKSIVRQYGENAKHLGTTRKGILSYQATLSPAQQQILRPNRKLYKRTSRGLDRTEPMVKSEPESRNRDATSEAPNEGAFGQSYFSKFFDNEKFLKYKTRKKRQGNPSMVFETRLLPCRPGRRRDVNGKCRNTILPSRHSSNRGIRTAPPISPNPSCPAGQRWGIRRNCVAANVGQGSLFANFLG